MLAGAYPSDEFAELRARVVWDRATGVVEGRRDARVVAVTSGGTIPDRGLYGVFLLGAGPGAARVGELDEEMVFESRVGETFVLGASSWRIEEITHDRVLVSPAPGEPGKMPFWKGDRAGRPLELGLAIGRLMHDLVRLPPAAAVDRLTREHDLDARAAENLLQYLRDQLAVARSLPDATTVVVERVRDVDRLRGRPVLEQQPQALWALRLGRVIHGLTVIGVRTGVEQHAGELGVVRAAGRTV
jgi:ATP-dependent Lhr-like helicase